MKEFLRALSESEHRLLKGVLAARKRQSGLIGRRLSILSVVVFTALGVLTAITSSKGSRQAITFVWLTIFGVAFVWSYFSARADILPIVKRLESAVRRSQARVVRVQATAVVEFEEEQDQGATYAFQLEGEGIVMISGQDFYSSAKFSNLSLHGSL